MGRFAAVLSRRGGDISSHLLRMLEVAPDPFADSVGLSTCTGTIVADTVERLDVKESPEALACSNRKIHSTDPVQPLTQYGYSFTLEGRLWERGSHPSIQLVADELDRDPIKGLHRLIRVREGSFTVTVLEEERIIAGRDTIGVVPIYLGEDREIAAVTSNRKMLWALGLEARPLPPGHIAKLTTTETSLETISSLSQPPILNTNNDKAVAELDRLLKAAVEARSRGHFRVSLGFSGGIDSGLLAYYLDDMGVDVELICVGMPGSRDFNAAERSAELLGIPLIMEVFTPDDVEAHLNETLWSIEEANPMKVAVALPLLLTAKTASEEGGRILFSGNGADELFAGYHRHAQRYREVGEAVGEMIFHDVRRSHTVNYERDYKVASDQGMELRLPYADERLVTWGLSIPPSLKLSGEPKSLRKIVLRNLALERGLPREIAERPKRAVQYSTGVNKTLKKIAKREGKSLRGYLAGRLEILKRDRSGG
ncbi:MAG: asparagine synthetase B [Candidatus Bathyarchaeota archaeon]